MRLILLLLVVPATHFAGGVNATAETKVEVISIWPAAAPQWHAPDQSEHDTSKPDSQEIAGKPVIRLGFVSQPELHIYRPAGKVQSETAVIVCPGGGYSILAWDLEGTEIAEWLQGIGVTTAVLKYRVPTRDEQKKWLAPVQDIQRSVSLIRSGAVKGFKPERIGVLGFSAGGNAAARAATAATRLSLFSELQRRDIAASLHVFAGGGHGFGARISNTADDHWPSLCESWMRDQGWLKK